MGLAEGRVADQHRRRAVHDAGGVPGVVDVADPLKMRILHHRDLVEAGHCLTHVLEGGLEGTKGLHVGAGAHVFVGGEDRQTVLVADRQDGFGKPPFGPSLRGAALGFHRQRVGLVAGKAVFGGDDVGADPLWDEVGLHRKGRVHGNRGPVRPHRDAAHHLDPAGDIGMACPALDLVGGKVYRLHSAGAEAVDRQARDAFVEV